MNFKASGTLTDVGFSLVKCENPLETYSPMLYRGYRWCKKAWEAQAEAQEDAEELWLQ